MGNLNDFGRPIGNGGYNGYVFNMAREPPPDERIAAEQERKRRIKELQKAEAENKKLEEANKKLAAKEKAAREKREKEEERMRRREEERVAQRQKAEENAARKQQAKADAIQKKKHAEAIAKQRVTGGERDTETKKKGVIEVRIEPRGYANANAAANAKVGRLELRAEAFRCAPETENAFRRAGAEARDMLAAVQAIPANQRRKVVQVAVDLVNDEKNRVFARAIIAPQIEKTEKLVAAVKNARSLQDTLRILKELKAPLRFLRVQQTLQDLLVTGCYQDLLDVEDEKEDVHDGNAPAMHAQPTVEWLIKAIEKRLDKDDKINTKKHLEDYIVEWTRFQVSRQFKTPEEIHIEVEQMRVDWKKRKHLQIEKLGFGFNFFYDELRCTLKATQRESEIEAHVEVILDYLCDITSEMDTRDYINREGLDANLEAIKTKILYRTQDFVKSNENSWKFIVNSQLIQQDVKRREILNKAILFGDEEMAREHVKQIEEMIQTAIQPVPAEKKQLLLPQLVEAHISRSDPNVRLEIVFDSTLSHEEKRKALGQLGEIFRGPSEMRNHPIITSLQKSVHKEFCANKEKLARLGVRAVLMREYGLDEMKVRNRPESNRIYSESGSEKADGFISTRYFEIKKEIETYFAPIGWRRIAVDIGLSADEFWDR